MGGGGPWVNRYLQTMPRRLELEMRTFCLFLSIGVQTFIFVVEGGQQAGRRSRKDELAKMSPLRLLAIALGYKHALSADTWPGPCFSSELGAVKAAGGKINKARKKGIERQTLPSLPIDSRRRRKRRHSREIGCKRERSVRRPTKEMKVAMNRQNQKRKSKSHDLSRRICGDNLGCT